MNEQKSDLVIYTTEDGLTKIDTTFDGDTVWLSIDQMAEFQFYSMMARGIKEAEEDNAEDADKVIADLRRMV